MSNEKNNADDADKAGRDDPVLAIAAEYESSMLAALSALEGSDTAAQMAACVRFGKVLAALRVMNPEDYSRVGAYLTERGRIPDFAWRKIVAAMQAFAAG